MADNRMYIRCKVCGRGHIIAKMFGITWGERKYNETLNEFFNKHLTCGFEYDPWLEQYEIAYENSMTDEELDRLYATDGDK